MAALIISSIFIWRRALPVVRQIFSTRADAAYLTLVVTGTACALAGARVRGLEYLGFGMVVVAVALESAERRAQTIVANDEIRTISRE